MDYKIYNLLSLYHKNAVPQGTASCIHKRIDILNYKLPHTDNFHPDRTTSPIKIIKLMTEAKISNPIPVKIHPLNLFYQ